MEEFSMVLAQCYVYAYNHVCVTDGGCIIKLLWMYQQDFRVGYKKAPQLQNIQNMNYWEKEMYKEEWKQIDIKINQIKQKTHKMLALVKFGKVYTAAE